MFNRKKIKKLESRIRILDLHKKHKIAKELIKRSKNRKMSYYDFWENAEQILELENKRKIIKRDGMQRLKFLSEKYNVEIFVKKADVDFFRDIDGIPIIKEAKCLIQIGRNGDVYGSLVDIGIDSREIYKDENINLIEDIIKAYLYDKEHTKGKL